MGPDVYLDHNATTPLDPRVIEAVAGALGIFGNPSSAHRFGERAAEAVERARVAVAALLGLLPDEIVFTSGGTESINTALRTALDGALERGRPRVLSSAVEHAAVLAPLAQEARRGFEVDLLPVDAGGRLATERGLELLERHGERTALLSLQVANNETGAVTPTEELEALARAARDAGALVHLDAVQGPGKLPLVPGDLPVDLVSISAHKFHGPKGVGALGVRAERLREFTPLLRGGSQERGRRAGTLNVPGIVGLGRAAELAREHAEDPAGPAATAALRDRLESELRERIPGAHVNAAAGPRLPNTTSLRVPGVPNGLLVPALAAAGIAISAGAACSSGRRGPSPVLLAMGQSPEEALSTVRISLGRSTTAEEIERVREVLPSVCAELIELSGAPLA